MIPKKIHYCWFGGNPLPQDALMCIESWKKYFPDYEIIEWNEKNFDMNSCDYIREAAENKKWAFVSDFARFKILYDFGGIYFDTDVEVVRNFDEIIAMGAFMGKEEPQDSTTYVINPGLGMAAEQGNGFCLDVMHIRAAFIIASEAIYSPSAEYKRVPDKIINKAKQWSEQYPKKIEFQEAYFGLLFSRLKYAQAQDMRNEQRRVYREMKTVAERANYSEYNESNQLMESVDILHRVFGY